MSANTSTETPTKDRTTVPVYTEAHSTALDAINALRKQKPPVKKTLTEYVSEALTEKAIQILEPSRRKTSKA